MPNPPIISVVGYSNSGKTRCMVELITRLKQRGYHVATLKHCHDGFALDVEGKDTWKHKRAGAKTTMMVGRGQVGIIVDQVAPLSLVELCERYTQDADIVLAEGFSWEPVPKILVASQKHFAEEKCAADPQLIALVNYQGTTSSLPIFTFAESSMDALVRLLEQTYLRSVSLFGNSCFQPAKQASA